MEGHRTAERRSLAYHRAIAERIVENPELVDEARERVRGWHDVHPRYVAAWNQLLSASPTAVAARLIEDSAEMTMLRQVSPFAGVLDARTRWQIWRTVA